MDSLHRSTSFFIPWEKKLFSCPQIQVCTATLTLIIVFPPLQLVLGVFVVILGNSLFMWSAWTVNFTNNINSDSSLTSLFKNGGIPRESVHAYLTLVSTRLTPECVAGRVRTTHKPLRTCCSASFFYLLWLRRNFQIASTFWFTYVHR